MSDPPHLPEPAAQALDRLVAHFRPQQSDPTYLVLKAHLLAEELLYDFVQGQVLRPHHVEKARLSFAQLIALAHSMHRFSADDWWGWAALQKLNSLRNLLAHNLEPDNLQERIVEFTVLVGEAITKGSEEVHEEYVRLATTGTHPFLLSLVALHIGICVTLGFDPKERSRHAEEAP
jgi:hypothetical protein